eukprot:jgi/Chrzof1/6985/Cz02g06170.t1
MVLTEGKSKNVINLILEDHNRARALYDQYKLPGITAEQKQILAWSLIRDVSMHSAKEEEVVYPAVREKMGDSVQEHLLGEHQDLKNLLSELNSMRITNPNFDGKLQEAMIILLQHMEEEETDVFPRFAKTPGVTEEYLQQLGRKFELAKLHAPTR